MSAFQTPLSNAQLELLDLFALQLPDDTFQELKQLLLQFKFDQLDRLADAEWETKNMTQQTITDRLNTTTALLTLPKAGFCNSKPINHDYRAGYQRVVGLLFAQITALPNLASLPSTTVHLMRHDGYVRRIRRNSYPTQHTRYCQSFAGYHCVKPQHAPDNQAFFLATNRSWCVAGLTSVLSYCFVAIKTPF
jgi:hypothetical protein